jgi:Fic family protein
MLYEELEKKRDFVQANINVLPKDVTANYDMAFLVEYTHESTAIEGNTLTLIQNKLLIEDGISVGGKELREIYEVTNHAKAFNYARKCVKEGKSLDESIVKDIHQILMENIMPGGIYRNVNVSIVGARHHPPSPHEMYYQIKSFYADLPLKATMSTIELAAWTHAEFVKIHPFRDGNGRTSRMIMNYQLMLSCWQPVVIKKAFRDRYFDALEEYHASGNLKPFVEFITELEELELDRLIESIKQIQSKPGN